MFLGMPTLIELNTLRDCAALCRDLGLSFIELNMNLPQYQLDAIDIADFNAIADEYGIFYTIHMDENLNVSDFNCHVADAYRRTVIETIDKARALNIATINMHLARGVYFTLPDKRVYLFSKYRRQYLNAISDFRKICEDSIADSQIKICIENSDGFTDFQREAIEILFESPAFGLTFDVGHNHCRGGADESLIMNNLDRLKHMHLHDAFGGGNHLPLGTGELDIDGYLKLAADQNCMVVLETKTIEGLKQSVSWMHLNGKFF